MAQVVDCRIDQCINDMQRYEEWGNLLAGQCFFNVSTINAPVSVLAIHNGLEYIKAKMKLVVLQDSSHTKEDKDRRLGQIDIDIRQTEDIIKRDLEYRRLLTL